MCYCNSIKEIIEYDSSIHQLKRWTQEFIAYELVIIHCVATMMKDIDSIYRYVDPFVHQYNITTIHIHSKDVSKRPFAYSFDLFTRYTNPPHVTASESLSISITISSTTSISTLYHNPIKISPIFPITIHPSILLPDHSSRVSSFIFVHLLYIIWISFDSVINSSQSILSTQGYNTLQHFICK